MSKPVEITTAAGLKFAAQFRADGSFASLHRIHATPRLVNGEYADVYDDYRSIAPKHPKRAAYEQAVRDALNQTTSL